MHSSLIAVVLCIFAQGAAACITAAGDTQQGAARMNTHVVQTPSDSTALITTANAGMRVAPRAVRAAPLASTQPDKDPPRRAGPAMLLAALALMSGIALRRYNAGGQ